MEKYLWDTKVEYLKTTRKQMWNDDYFEFLIRYVWKIDTPQNIIDFGCGYGYLGMKLLPLLPEGSTYTGIDLGDELLEEAKTLFENSPYKVEFIKANLQDYKVEKQYDIAICQAFLRHIAEPKQVLKKMIDSVEKDGMVICIEVNRRMENSGLYIDSPFFNASGNDNLLNEQWELELRSGGRDFMFGIKIPIYMEQMGLHNVGVRVNDYVEYVSPVKDKEQYGEHMKNFCDSNGIENSLVNEQNAALLARRLLISFGVK